MGIEIEKKFLLANDNWRDQVHTSVHFRQGYLIGSDKSSVRVRIEGDKSNLNIKGATLGVRRQEFEYPIPMEDANELLSTLCAEPLIEKTRHYVKVGEHTWEIDEFSGDNQGLIVAEVELSHENEIFEEQEWLGEEVSEDTRYYNSMLIKNPYKNWKE
ncbi:MAG: CYTH domain-containing protein [Gammaproteobacteria bacterium]|nr:CYTH domain-containing protein [Gammaproteobacteria bacterium]